MTPTWTTAVPDWEKRIVARESLIPFKPLFPDQGRAALDVFKSLPVVDVTGRPTFGECSEQWVFDFVEAIFGAYDPDAARRLITEFFLLISKKNTKSTLAAGIMVTALCRNWRHSAELLILAPTIEIAGNSFKPAADMVRNHPKLKDLLHVQDNFRTITHLTTGAALKVVSAETDVVSGKKAAFVLIDELWIFGKRPNADAMFREATGGMVSRPEGFTIYLSTQSDAPPAGVFEQKLRYFRQVRDGKINDPKSLGVLYEFPQRMVDREEYLEPKNFYVSNPNIGRSVDTVWMRDQLAKLVGGDKAALNTHLAKHLNVEIGQNLRTDRWVGADFWSSAKPQSARASSLKDLLARCEVVVVGIDGGGLDDLLGFAVLGREKKTGNWLLWSRAWAHQIVKERRKQIVTDLERFVREDKLKFVDNPGDDVDELVDIVRQIEESGKLAGEAAIGVDAAGIGEIVTALTADEDNGIAEDRIVGVSQGWKLTGAIKTTERRLAAGTLIHDGSELMKWCVGNAKAEAKGSATTINKALSGAAKIDPLMALYSAVTLMSLNPQAAESAYEDEDYVL